MNHIPDKLEVNPEVVVDEPISHARHRAPLDVRMRRPEVIRDLLRGFPDDLQTPNESPALLPIR